MKATFDETAWFTGVLHLSLRPRPVGLRYGVTLGATLLTVLLVLLLAALTRYSPFVLPLGAVAFSMWYGGVGPGLLSALVSLLGVGLFYPSLSVWNRSLMVQGLVQGGLFALIAGWLLTRLEDWQEYYRRYLDERAIVRRLEDERSVLVSREEAARATAEGLTRRMAFLSETSDLLATSLNYQVTLGRLARLAVSYLADWCLVDMTEPDGSVRRVGAYHADPDKQALVETLLRFPPNGKENHPVVRVLYTGKPELLARVGDRLLDEMASGPEHRETLRRLGTRSLMVVPLVSRGQTLGTISFVLSGPKRVYEPADLEYAQELARRAALGVDNARLYQSAQEEIIRRKQAQEELARNQARVGELNDQLQRAMTETHHRVKNNLQIIAAMVDMQLMDHDESVPVPELQRIVTHIRTLASVHDILTFQAKEEGQMQSVSGRAVLEKLIPMLQSAAGIRPIRASVEEARLSMRQSTSLAVIVNELVSNALKYGRGEVYVRFRRQEGEAVLEVCDDGPGFPEGFNPARAANTGLELVENLSRWDLGGHATYENRSAGGARVTIHIPIGE